MLLLIGTYTEGSQAIPNEAGEYAQGIYTCVVEGDRVQIAAIESAINPSFLAQHPTLRVIYAVVERAGNPGGAVACYRLNVDGSMALISTTPSLGDDPCHLMVAPGARYLVVTNYSSGDFTSIALNGEGHFDGVISYVQHWGQSVDPVRQMRPHAHSSGLSPDGKFLYVADLGTDQIARYPITNSGKVDANERRSMRVSAGAGPRHFCFDSNNEDMYLINELNSTITRLTSDQHAVLIERQSCSSVPMDYKDTNHTAHICFSRDRRYLYGSNRGHDSIVVLLVSGSSLSPVQFAKSGGRHPRHFACTEDSIIVAHRDTGNVCGLCRDPATGLIGEAQFELEVPSAAFVLPVRAVHRSPSGLS